MNINKGISHTETVRQDSAEWAADTTVYAVNEVLVPTDGANKGKHKLGNGADIYSALSFVEDGSGGSTTIPLETTAATAITLAASHFGKITVTTAATTVTVTIPDGLALGLAESRSAGFRQEGAGQVVFATSGSASLVNTTGGAATYAINSTAWVNTTTTLDKYNLNGQVE